MRGRRPESAPPQKSGFFTWLKRLFGFGGERGSATRVQTELRALTEFQEHFRVQFGDPDLLKLALTHRSYLSVTGQGPRESNERLEFLGDSVLGLVTSEYLYRENPEEHEGDLTKSKSLLVSKAILSRRALAMGLGRFVLMSHSEVESGGRQRLSILADAFEAVIGAIYLDQGFEPAREFIHKWLLRESGAIVADKRHTNYKSHLQEYVQSTWRTHPVYRIRSEMGPDHSKHFLVEVLVGKRGLGEGRGRNKKEAEQAAARNALERAGVMPADDIELEVDVVDEPREERGGELRRSPELQDEMAEYEPAPESESERDDERGRGRRRGRRGGRGVRERERERGPLAPVNEDAIAPDVPEVSSGRLATPSRRLAPLPEPPPDTGPALPEKEPPPVYYDDDEEVGRPEGPFEALHVDPYAWGAEPATLEEAVAEPPPAPIAPRREPRSERGRGSHRDEPRRREPREPSAPPEQADRDDRPREARFVEVPREASLLEPEEAIPDHRSRDEARRESRIADEEPAGETAETEEATAPEPAAEPARELPARPEPPPPPAPPSFGRRGRRR